VDLTHHGGTMCSEILRRLHAQEGVWMSGMPENRRQSLIRLLGEVKGQLNAD
jgi:hypothetical protein